MRQFDYVDNVIVLDEKEEYIKAIKGENHMAFLKENYSYVLSSEDKDAIISAMASPASTSPPIVFNIIKRPSTSLSCSILTFRKSEIVSP